MCAKEIPFGHSGSQAPVLEQFPKSSSYYLQLLSLLFYKPCHAAAWHGNKKNM